MIRSHKQELEWKRQQVRRSYSIGNMKLYEKQFDELHDLNMVFMAADFRKKRGLPSYAKTPYCP